MRSRILATENACCTSHIPFRPCILLAGGDISVLRQVDVLGTRTLLWFRHGCSGHRILLEHERDYGLGMDALVIVCTWSTNVIMV